MKQFFYFIYNKKSSEHTHNACKQASITYDLSKHLKLSMHSVPSNLVNNSHVSGPLNLLH